VHDLINTASIIGAGPSNFIIGAGIGDGMILTRRLIRGLRSPRMLPHSFAVNGMIPCGQMVKTLNSDSRNAMVRIGDQ